MRKRTVKWIPIAGVGGASLAVVLLALRVSFMETWFYIFTWWSLILLLDGLNYRVHGSSPLCDSPQDFLFLAFISVFIWLVFELFNLRLQNWSYHDLPASIGLRWAGYFLAFATVAPALKELACLCHGLFKDRKYPKFQINIPQELMFLSGLIFCLLTLTWPHLFFPLVWLGVILLLEPVNRRLGGASLSRDLENGHFSPLLSWILAGFTAGWLWEFLNFLAGGHWEYSLPYFEFGRIFQMPVLGYFGFLPFALEVYVMVVFGEAIRQRMRGKIWLQLASAAAMLAFYAAMFHLMDRYTWAG